MGNVDFSFGLFLGIGPALYEYLDDAGSRNGKQHARDPKEVSHDAYGQQDKERVQTGGLADHLGVDIVGVDLLDQNETADRSCCVKKTAGEKGGDECRNHAKKRSEIRNDVQNAADDADEYSVVDFQDAEDKGGKECHEKTVDECPLNKS